MKMAGAEHEGGWGAGTAMTAALDAEYDAGQARAAAETRAQSRIAAARQQALIIRRRADARIARAQGRAGALAQAEIGRIRLRGDAVLNHSAAAVADSAAVATAARCLARQLSSACGDRRPPAAEART
ncbi:MAG: hypothetical protein KGJ55_01220 [Gammaproteobacteria bacterium]|nr:hypothetical protein [Gammaproteobacteria bacterium]